MGLGVWVGGGLGLGLGQVAVLPQKWSTEDHLPGILTKLGVVVGLAVLPRKWSTEDHLLGLGVGWGRTASVGPASGGGELG